MIRVSQVLSLFQNLWKIPQDVLARKGEQGTRVHSEIFNWLLGGERSGNLYLESFIKWWESRGLKIAMMEERMSDELLGFTGQPDAVFRDDDTRFLVDFKTSVKDDPVSWRLQGTAYIHLLRKNGYEVDDLFYFLKLNKDGSMPTVFAYRYTAEGWDTFLKALDCAKYFQKWKGDLPDY